MLKSLASRLPWGARKNFSHVEALVLDFLDATTGGHRSYAQIVSEAYRRNSVVARSINLITTNASSVKPLLYQRARDGNDEELHEHPLLTLVRRPNRRTSYRRFIETIILHRFLSGSAFILRLPTGRGRPLELQLLRPDLVTVRSDGRLGGELRFEYQVSAGARSTYTEADVLWLHGINPLSDTLGHSPVESVLTDIDGSNLAGAWNTSLLRNSGRPSALVISKSVLTDSQMQHLQQAKQSMFGGHANAGKIAVIDGQDIEWRELGHTAKDMDWLQGRKHAEAMIAVGLGVPPELVGLSEHKTFSNYEQAQKALWTETIVPELEYVYEELTGWLAPNYGDDLYLSPWWDQVPAMQADKGREAERIERLVRANVISFGQAAEDLGYEVREDMREWHAWELEFVTRFGVPPNSRGPTTGGATTGDASTPGSEAATSKTTLSPVHKSLTEEQKAAYWQGIDLQRQAFIASVSKRVADQFRVEHNTVVDAIRDSSTVEAVAGQVEATVEQLVPAWGDLLTATWLGTMEAFAENTLSNMKTWNPRLSLKEAAGIFGTYHAEAVEHASKTAAEHVTSITETTKARLRLLTEEAVRNGQGIPEIIASIDKLYLDEIIPNRSEVIARTEVHEASETGSFMAARGTGLDITKTWVSTPDARTRKPPDSTFDHVSVNGQERPLDEPFDVSGEQLMHPGDTSLGATAGNTIQCRCTVAYSA